MLGQTFMLNDGTDGTIISESMGDIIIMKKDGIMILRKTDRTERLIHDFKKAPYFTTVDEEKLVATLDIPKPELTPEQKQKEKEKIISTKKLIRKSNKKASDN